MTSTPPGGSVRNLRARVTKLGSKRKRIDAELAQAAERIAKKRKAARFAMRRYVASYAGRCSDLIEALERGDTDAIEREFRALKSRVRYEFMNEPDPEITGFERKTDVGELFALLDEWEGFYAEGDIPRLLEIIDRDLHARRDDDVRDVFELNKIDQETA